VEPSIAASLVDRNGDGANDVIVGYQQDRWDNGGSRGIYASVLINGRISRWPSPARRHVSAV
jgi:hypothetical protein